MRPFIGHQALNRPLSSYGITIEIVAETIRKGLKITPTNISYI